MEAGAQTRAGARVKASTNARWGQREGNQRGGGGGYLLDHVKEVLALCFAEGLELLDGVDVELVLGLGLGRLEGAGQDGDAGVLQHARHLGVAEVLVDYDAVDQRRVFQAAPRFPLHLLARTCRPSPANSLLHKMQSPGMKKDAARTPCARRVI